MLSDVCRFVHFVNSPLKKTVFNQTSLWCQVQDREDRNQSGSQYNPGFTWHLTSDKRQNERRGHLQRNLFLHVGDRPKIGVLGMSLFNAN